MHLRCDHCGGPADWCFIDGEAHFHCQRECVFFCQLELFAGDEGLRHVSEILRLDRIGSVSALDEDEDTLPF